MADTKQQQGQQNIPQPPQPSKTMPQKDKEQGQEGSIFKEREQQRQGGQQQSH